MFKVHKYNFRIHNMFDITIQQKYSCIIHTLKYFYVHLSLLYQYRNYNLR